MTRLVRDSIVPWVKLATIASLLPTLATGRLLGQLLYLSVPLTIGAKLPLLLTRASLGQDIIDAANIWLSQSRCIGTR